MDEKEPWAPPWWVLAVELALFVVLMLAFPRFALMDTLGKIALLILTAGYLAWVMFDLRCTLRHRRWLRERGL